MKTKQPYMIAKFTKQSENGKNRSGEKPLIQERVLVDKKTERHIVTARWYMSNSRNASTVYCSVWVHGIQGVDGVQYTAGNGSAGGYGYHKSSAAFSDALSSAGIELYGSPYGHPVNGDTPAQTRKMLKQRAHIGGCGDGSVECAMLAIAYAAGYKDCILV